MLTYKQWLDKYGGEDCCGCEWNNPAKARCNYRGRCARYDAYVRDEKRKNEQLSLF